MPVSRRFASSRENRSRRRSRNVPRQFERLEPRQLLAADVVINELMYQSFTDLGQPEDYREEYIELYNRGDAAADLLGWRLDDGVQFDFSAGTLGAGQYLVVTADPSVFHSLYPSVTNYIADHGWDGHLSNSGERVALVDQNGTVIDQVEYADEGDWNVRQKVQFPEFSHNFGSGTVYNEGLVWANSHDGGGKSLELINPAVTNNVGQNWAASIPDGGTPGVANSVAASNIAPLITDVGHYPEIPRSSDPITVRARVRDELTTGVSVTLHYREDGDPDFNTLSMYDDGLHNDEWPGDGIYGATIAAGTFADGVIVEFYVEASDAAAHARTWPGPVEPVAPITQGGQIANCLLQIDNSFDPDAPWTPGTPPVFRVITTAADWAYFQQWADISNRDYKPNGQVNATFIATDGVGTEVRYELGLRNRGNGSRAHNPHNLRLNLPNDRPYKNYKALVMNAQRPYSQVLGSAIFRYADVPAADGVQVKVLTNGVDRADVGTDMYGYYLWIEAMDTEFVENHWPADNGGNLYRCNYYLPGGRTDATLEYIDDDPDSYRNEYNKQTNVAADDFSDLIHMLDVLNNSPDATFWEDVNEVIDVQQWVRYMSVNTLLGSTEGGLITGDGDDYALYAGVVDPRFTLLPYDLDTITIWGSGANLDIWSYRDTALPGLYRLLNDPHVVQIYYQQLLDLTNTVFTPEIINPLVDQVLGGWRSEATRTDVKDWIAARVANVLGQIPQDVLSVQTSLPVSGGYPRTTDDLVGLSGTGEPVYTGSILVDGQLADWDPEQHTWSIGSGAGNATQLLFQNEVSPDASYLGTLDTEIRFSNPTGNLGQNQTINVDGSSGGGAVHGLIQFQDLFGTGPGQVAPTDPIAAATLTLQVFDPGDTMHLHRMLVPWSESDNWDTFGGNGVQANDIEAASAFISASGGTGTLSIDVTEAVEKWQAGDWSDYGWVFLPTGGGGVDFYSSESGSAANRPKLTVTLDDAEPSGVPLPLPGLNRVVVEAFDGENGTGNKLDETYIDIWHDSGRMNVYPDGDTTLSTNLIVRDSYLPGEPVLVRVEVRDQSGEIYRELWDATATLSASGGVTMDVDQITLFNGLGSALVTFTGTGSFNLTAEVGGVQDSDDLTDLTGAPVTTVSGTLSEPSGTTTWSGVVHVTGDVLVPAGHTLSIDPGTLIRIDGVASGTAGVDIDVVGEIRSLGTEDRPITFTAYNAAEEWGEIHHNGADPSLYQYTNIILAGHSPTGGHTNSGPAVRPVGSTIVFEYVNITDNAGKVMQSTGGSDLTFRDCILARSVMGPEIDNTALWFEDSWITENHGPNDNDGIYIHSQSAGQECTLRGGVIADTHDDGLDTLQATVLVEDYIFRNMVDKGISVFGGEVTINGMISANNDIGISAKDQSHAEVYLDHATITGNRLGIQAENKDDGMPNGLIEYSVTNSIVYGNSEYAVRSHYPLDPIHFGYSIVGGSWVHDREYYDPPDNTPIVWTGEIWAGNANDNTDPIFVNPASADFHLQTGSPAVGAAADGSDLGYYPAEVTGSGGELIADTVWRPENGQYRITGQLTVPAAYTLTIMPGTTVFFDDGASLLVEGRLDAQGTPDALIRFAHAAGATDWEGIQFNDTMADNRITYAIVEHSTRVDGMIQLTASNLLIDHVTLDHADRRRIRADDSSLIVRNSTFTDFVFAGTPPNNVAEHIYGGYVAAGGHFIVENNTFGLTPGHNDAIDFNAGHRAAEDPVPQILNNVFLGGGDDALDVEGDFHIEGNLFMHYRKDAYHAAVDGGESNVISAGDGHLIGHEYVVTRNVFYDADHVSLVKEGSFMTFTNNTVVDVDQGPYAAVPGVFSFDLIGQTNMPGDGAYLDGNIFTGTPLVFNNLDSRGTITDLTVNRSILPAAEHHGGSGNLDADPRLADPAGGDFSLAGGSPARGTGPVGQDMGADVPAGALISPVPLTLSYRTGATLAVAGYAYPDHTPIFAYKYRLNGGAWSGQRTPGTPIVLAGLSNGPQLLEVIAQNSAGAWQDAADAYSASWTVDTSLSRVLVNEILAINGESYLHDSIYPDVIELYNDSRGVTNISGWSISDDPTHPTKYVFAAGTTIGVENYLVLHADDAPAISTGIYLGFKIDGDGEGVYLYDATQRLVDSIEFGVQVEDLSIGRVGPDRSWSLAQPTIGASNVAQPVGEPSGVLINEWFTNGDVVLLEDFIELYNPDTLPVDVAGLYLTDNPANQKTKQQIPLLSFIGAEGFQDLKADDQDRSGHVNFRLSAKMEILGLFDADVRQLDRIYYGPQTEDVSQGRTPDGSDTIEFYTLPTPGVGNVRAGDPFGPLLDLHNDLRITELMYNPTGSDSIEFIELQNTGANTIDLAGARFTDGVDFVFPAVTLDPGEYVVVARDLAAFQAWYGTGINAVGSYDPDALNNAGENIVLQMPEPYEAAILRFEYDDDWYPSADGDGPSLVINNPLGRRAAWRERSAWHAGSVSGGSPGADEPTAELPAGAVVINETLARSNDPVRGDWIELHNTTAADIDVSGWFLSNDPAVPEKFVISGDPGHPFAPGNTILPAGGYLAFNQVGHFGIGSGHPGSLIGFGLSEHGDEVILSSADISGNLGTYRAFAVFGATENDVTLGRHTISTGTVDFVALSAPTYEALNAAPLVGPIVFEEIMYHPVEGGNEYLLLRNVSGSPVDLLDPLNPDNTWRLTGGVTFTFPQGVTVPAGGYVLVTDATPATYLATHDVPANVQLFGPFDIALSNAGERITLEKPGTPETLPEPFVPYITAESVQYDDDFPWPEEADGDGPALSKLASNTYGNDPVNWGTSGAPVVTVDLLTTADRTPALTGTVADAHMPAEVRVTVNGSEYIAPVANGIWTLPDDTIAPPLANGTYDVAAAASDLAGNLGTDATTDELVVDTGEPSASVVGRHIFYNNSAFDGNNPAANELDDDAIATDKEALRPDQTASGDNYTSYSRGINGIMVDIAGLANPDELNLENLGHYFEFHVGDSDDPTGWGLAPAPSNVAVRESPDVQNAQRVTLVWPDYAIRNEWLQVTVLTGSYTGLMDPEVFYFGNAVGESGNSDLDAEVNETDVAAARNNPHSFFNPAVVTSAYDYNRDARVNATDMLIAQSNPTDSETALKLIHPPALEGEGAWAEESPVLASLQRDPAPAAASPSNSLGKWAWLYEFDQMPMKHRPSEKHNPAAKAVDKLLATWRL